jgi:hydroxymethylpyrimidine/phosphomethylpyrimidine kinase
VTPNIPEAEALSGVTIRTDDDRRLAAKRIAALGAKNVVIKGGHLPTDDVSDLLCTHGEFVEFRHRRVPGRHTHGTGCTFAAAITAMIALGTSLTEAIPLAQEYVAGAIAAAPALGKGHGPVDHFYKWRSGTSGISGKSGKSGKSGSDGSERSRKVQRASSRYPGVLPRLP